MLEDRSIDIWAYNLETVLAEKLETIITRTTTNTRMRDFYDIYILEQLHGNTLNRQTLHDALRATVHKRGTEQHLAEAVDVLNEVESSPVMQKLWESCLLYTSPIWRDRHSIGTGTGRHRLPGKNEIQQVL